MKSFQHRGRKNSVLRKNRLTCNTNTENNYGDLTNDLHTSNSGKINRKPNCANSFSNTEPYNFTNGRNDQFKLFSTQNKWASARIKNVYKKFDKTNYFSSVMNFYNHERTKSVKGKRRNLNFHLILRKKDNKVFPKKKIDSLSLSMLKLKGRKLVAMRKESYAASPDPIKSIKEDTNIIKRNKYKSSTSYESRKIVKELVISEEFKIPTNTVIKLNREKSYPWVKQLHFNLREKMKKKLLTIIQFDGVIGDFNPSVLCQTQSLTLKIDICSVIKSLLKRTRIGILFKCTKEKAEFAIKHLANIGVKADASYVVIKDPWTQLPVNYEKILKDFNIKSDEVLSKVIIVASYDSENFFFDQINTKFYDTINSVPILFADSYYKDMPLIVLIRNSKFSNKTTSIAMLTMILMKLIEIDIKNEWSQVKSHFCNVINTEEIQMQYIKDFQLDTMIESKKKKHQKSPIREKHKVKEIIQNDVKVNEEFLKLQIMNENIKERIYTYCEERKNYKDNNKKVQSKMIIDNNGSHRLIVIKGNDTPWYKLQPTNIFN